MIKRFILLALVLSLLFPAVVQAQETELTKEQIATGRLLIVLAGYDNAFNFYFEYYGGARMTTYIHVYYQTLQDKLLNEWPEIPDTCSCLLIMHMIHWELVARTIDALYANNENASLYAKISLWWAKLYIQTKDNFGAFYGYTAEDLYRIWHTDIFDEDPRHRTMNE